MLELELAGEVASEHRPERPEHGRARSPPRSRPGRFADGSSGCGWLTSQKPARAGRKNHQKPGRGRSPSKSAAAPTATSGWTFWITTGRDEVGVADERVGEEDRGDGRRARADRRRRPRRSAGRRGTTARSAGRRSGSVQQDEDHVLAEDDRRRRRRRAHRLADDRVRAPHRRGDGDEDDPGNPRQPHGRSKRRRSSTVSRARISRASPSATSTTAGRGTPLYVEPSASV